MKIKEIVVGKVEFEDSHEETDLESVAYTLGNFAERIKAFAKNHNFCNEAVFKCDDEDATCIRLKEIYKMADLIDALGYGGIIIERNN